MQYVDHFLNIDLHADRTSGAIHIRERNVGHRLKIMLNTSGETFEFPEDGAVEFVYQREDESRSSFPVSVADGLIEFALPLEVVELPGGVSCMIVIFRDGHQWTATPEFRLEIAANLYDTQYLEQLTAEVPTLEAILGSEGQRVLNENARQENEGIRQANETDREAYIDELKAAVLRGDFNGKDGETDYENLTHLPRINGVALLGDKSAEDLFLIGEISNEEILQIWNTVMN